jgi:uncharacterized protein YcbK (DUF882 family)
MPGQRKHTRRAVLLLASGALATVLAGPAAEAAHRPFAARSIALHNLHTGERFNSVYWEQGAYIPESLHRLNWLLRDHRTEEACRINPELIDVLAQLHQKLRTREPFQVLSGYRSPSTNAMLAAMTDGVAQNSLHMHGKAIDIRVPDRSLVKVHRAAVALEAGGVGYYPRSDFVHIDVGRVRQWHR